MATARDYFFIFVSIVCCVAGQLLLKTGMTQVGRLTPCMMLSLPVIIQIATNPFVVGGLLVYMVSLCSWFVVLSRVDLSFAYPMLGLNYVLILFFSWLILGENITVVRTAGVLLIFLGVVFISRDKRKRVKKAMAPEG